LTTDGCPTVLDPPVPTNKLAAFGIRFIASGSIRYKGSELTAGDWMYIPTLWARADLATVADHKRAP